MSIPGCNHLIGKIVLKDALQEKAAKVSEIGKPVRYYNGSI
jgi:hypothetical protein